jgi:glucose/arabinose dehydrogenase
MVRENRVRSFFFSRNRDEKIGYRVMQIDLKNSSASSYQEFMTGFLENEQAWGRPVDVLNMPDGSILVSDDKAGAIYKIQYEP